MMQGFEQNRISFDTDRTASFTFLEACEKRHKVWSWYQVLATCVDDSE